MVDSLVELGVELEEVEFDEAGVVDDVLEEEDELEDDVFVEAELVEFDDEVGEVEDDAAAGEAEDGVVDVEAVEEFPLESPEFDDAADEELEDAPDDSPFDDALVALVELVSWSDRLAGLVLDMEELAVELTGLAVDASAFSPAELDELDALVEELDALVEEASGLTVDVAVESPESLELLFVELFAESSFVELASLVEVCSVLLLLLLVAAVWACAPELLDALVELVELCVCTNTLRIEYATSFR
nr:MAG: hypothetical protein AmFV_00151 [Apis mellifera filamentous virus]WOK43264.1 MAG: hypothetical protein [Apis mellifera filamentous virus]